MQEIKVKPGYKMTELGVIPEDWNSIDLQNVVSNDGGLVRGPFGGALKKEIFVKNGFKVYEQKNAIYRNNKIGEYYIDKNKFNELKRFEVKSGDFIVSCSGTIGKIYQIPNGSQKGVINQALLKIKLDNQIINNEYFYYQFDWDKFQNKIIDGTQGGAMKNLVGMDIFKKTKLPVPKNINEQKNIAQVLSDIDKLINSLDELINKKENIKDGAMQELLTGKRRLPGFDGKWEEKKLGDICEFYKGKGLPKSDIVNGGKYKCIHYGELFTTYNELITYIQSSTNIIDNVFLSKSNDVLMPTSDVTPNGLATASCIRDNGIILGGDVLVIRFEKGKMDGLFFSYYVTQHRDNVMKLVTGTTVYHLYGSDMNRFEGIFPEIDEQRAIANILTNIDKEIKVLEEKMNKYKQIKEGMMQELLTGKIRLV